MIKLCKRPAPPKPIRSEYDYRNNPNWDALLEDCYGKCYICENDKATSLNVEHRVSHHNDISIKYDWNNLFLSCGHCNNIKLNKYDDIIDPAICDPEDYIALSLTIVNFRENVSVETLAADHHTMQTAKLLGYVYNGGTTDIKEVECANLRNAVSECVTRFLLYIKGYLDEPDLGYDVIIKKEISRSSAFAAFKRKIIRDNVELLSMFASSLI